MSRSVRLASLVLLLIAMLALGACGGGGEVEEKNAYVRELNAAQSEFKRKASSVAQQKVPDEAAGKVRLVQRLAGAIDEVVGTLRGIDAPGDVRAEHEQLIDVMSDFRADVRKLTQTYRGGDVRKVSAQIVEFKAAEAEADARIGAAIDAINSKLAAT